MGALFRDALYAANEGSFIFNMVGAEAILRIHIHTLLDYVLQNVI